MERVEFLERVHIEAHVLETWVAAGWITPSDGTGPKFSDLDVARARLIQDLTSDIGVNEAGIGVILDLLDQLHGLRRSFGSLLTAVQTQPEGVRTQLALAIHQAMIQDALGPSRPDKTPE